MAAFSELGFRPHIADLPRERDQSTTVLGQDISFPVIISPTGVQAVHPEGEVAVARAAAAAGTAMGLSSFASKPIEDVAEANPKTFFQMYWVGDRDRILQRAERAKKAGAKALIVTLDWSFATAATGAARPSPRSSTSRRWSSSRRRAILRPRWLLDLMRHGGLPDLTTPNLAAPGEEPPTFFGAYGQWMGTPLPTWDDVAWLREQWDGPFWSRGSCIPTTPGAPSTPAPPRSRCPTTAATTSTAPRRRSGRCPASSTPSATRSRCCSTAASAAAATSSRRWRSARGP